ncbi:MAG: cytochrome b/b6 domain-containing protein, partial [Chloroflexota bacterium]
TRTERAVHWMQASSFLLLLLTGLALQLPSIEAAIGNRELLHEIHLSAAFFFFFGPALIALSGNRQSVSRDVTSVDTWDGDDLRWLVPFPLLRLFGVRTPPQGRFNAGQKLNAIFIVWSTLTFTVTGLIIWQNRRFNTTLVSHANSIHTWLAYIALVAFLGHLYLAVGYPKTRHALRAITQGWVRREWAVEHHAKWVREGAAAYVAPAYDRWRTAAQLILGTFVCLFAVRVLFFDLGANVTDKVTTWLYDATAWPGTASTHPQTAVHIADWRAIIYFVILLIAWMVIDQLRRVPRRQSSANRSSSER